MKNTQHKLLEELKNALLDWNQLSNKREHDLRVPVLNMRDDLFVISKHLDCFAIKSHFCTRSV